MQRILVICVGKLRERFYIDAAAEYVKRLHRFCRLDVLELLESRLPEAPSPAQILQALEREAAAIREKIPAHARVTALCVEGEMLSSEAFSQLLTIQGNSEKCLVFIIGSSYGLHPSLKARADLRLSMSPMTFPHHLARVMLLEQIYRGFQINSGGRYHK